MLILSFLKKPLNFNKISPKEENQEYFQLLLIIKRKQIAIMRALQLISQVFELIIDDEDDIEMNEENIQII